MSQDIQQKIVDARLAFKAVQDEIAAMSRQMEDLEYEARDYHEKSKAKSDERIAIKRKREEKTKELQGLHELLNSLGVRQAEQNVLTMAKQREAAAQANEAKAAEVLAELEKQKAELAALIEQAKAASKSIDPVA